jgi:CTP synthase
MAEQRGIQEKGATMRLGAYECALEARHPRRRGLRHGHRLASATATATRSTTPTAINSNPPASSFPASTPNATSSRSWNWRETHPWFLAVQFHPEFQSKPNRAHPLFAAFIAAGMKRHQGKA